MNTDAEQLATQRLLRTKPHPAIPRRMATDKQRQYIGKLLRTRKVNAQVQAAFAAKLDGGDVTSYEATRMIEQLKSLPWQDGL